MVMKITKSVTEIVTGIDVSEYYIIFRKPLMKIVSQMSLYEITKLFRKQMLNVKVFYQNLQTDNHYVQCPPLKALSGSGGLPSFLAKVGVYQTSNSSPACISRVVL